MINMTFLFKIEPMENMDIFDVSLGIKSPPIYRQWQNNTWVIDRKADKFLFPYVMDIYRGDIF